MIEHVSFMCHQIKTELYISYCYSHAMPCGRDIETLLWFHQSQFYFVDTIETRLLCGSSSNLADILITMKKLNPIYFRSQSYGQT